MDLLLPADESVRTGASRRA